MNKLISARPCVWDVTNSYLTLGVNRNYPNNPSNLSKLKKLQKMETNGTPPPTKIKTVELNGHITIFELGKKNEYYSKNGQTLTGLILASSSTRGNKLKIY
jgi:hypothetical protein